MLYNYRKVLQYILLYYIKNNIYTNLTLTLPGQMNGFKI